MKIFTLLLLTMLITGPVSIGRDVIISLRHRASRLARPTRQLITQLGCGPKYVKPRGCRAGQHVQQRRLQARNQTTIACGSVGACEPEAKPKLIPVVVGNRSTAGIRRTLHSRVIVDVIQRSATAASPSPNQSALLISPTSSIMFATRQRYNDTSNFTYISSVHRSIIPISCF